MLHDSATRVEPHGRDRTPSRPGLEYALLGLLALLWGSSYLFIRVAVTEIPPLTLIAMRVAGAAVVLLAVMRWRRVALPGRRVWPALLVQAFLNSIGAWTVLAWGQQFVGAGLASVLNSTSPVFVVLLLALGGDRPGWRRAAGCLIGIAGVVLVVGPGALDGRRAELAGGLACLAGALLYAGAAYYGRRLNGIGALQTATGTMLWASLVLVPAALIVERPWRLAPSVQALGAVAVLSVACTGLALILYFRLLRTLGPAGVASQSYLRAGIGLLLGVVVLGETITPGATLGLALVLAGVVLLNRRQH